MDFRILGRVVPQPSSTILGVTVAAFCPEHSHPQYVDLNIDNILIEIDKTIMTKPGVCRQVPDGIRVRFNPKSLGNWAKLNRATSGSGMNFDQASIYQHTDDFYQYYKDIKIENL